MNETLAKMKMCRLCDFPNDYELHPNSTWYHEERGMHTIMFDKERKITKLEAPISIKHKDYELHKKWCGILGLKC